MSVRPLKKTVFITVLLVMTVGLCGAARVYHYAKSPDVLFLVNRSDAQWIKQDSEFDLEAKKAGITQNVFRYVFVTPRSISNAHLHVQAFKRFQLFFDGVLVFVSEGKFEQWKKIYHVAVPFPVAAGLHEIIIDVQCENSHPAVMVYSDTLPVKSNSGWYVSADYKTWGKAVPASFIQIPAISKKFPPSWKALAAISPFLAIVFILSFFIFFFGEAIQKTIHFSLEPSTARWVVLLLWALLSLNNLFRLNFQVGADGWGHIDYLEFLLRQGSLPLAPDGWQMFQPPLAYLLSLPFYTVIVRWFDWPVVIKMMGVITVVCGLLQIEITYRIARFVFASRKDLQMIALLTGSLLPIHTYICQYFGNEPFLGVWLSLLILLIVPHLTPQHQEQKIGHFVLIGLVWGLALLTKMTAVLMAPVFILVFTVEARLIPGSRKAVLKPMAVVFGVALLISGWYYIRNAVELGNPFAGVLDHQHFIKWWQDPGYRTWSQLLSFGQSFVWPIYSGVTSFWDAVYTTLWLDGFNSGVSTLVPWNENFMIAGQILALIPCLLIVVGIVHSLCNPQLPYRNFVLFSCSIIILFLAAMLDRFIHCAFYSSTRSIYMLGLAPAFAILVAAGAVPFLHKRILRSLVMASWTCWAFASYVAYFVTSPP